MSIKTLRKRIALVAVSALGAGLMSVAPATAAAGNLGNVTASNVCVVTSSAGSPITASAEVYTTPDVIYIPAGNTFTVVISDGAQEIRISDGAIGQITSSSDTTNISITQGGTVATATSSVSSDTITVRAISAGKFTVKSFDDAADTGAADTITVNVVASCSTGVFDLSSSYAELQDNSYSAANDLIDDVSYVVNGETLFLSMRLFNAYGQKLPAGTFNVKVSSGAVVGINGANSAPSCSTLSEANLSDDGDYVNVAVCQATDNVPWSGTITVSYNGTALLTKSGTIRGALASIAASTPTIGATGTTTYRAFTVNAYDSAGNRVGSVSPTVVASTLGQLVTNVISASTSETASVRTGNGITCAAGKGGTAEVQLKATSATGATIYSNKWTATCGGALYTFSASLDKASYKPGEIATLTIKGLDAYGLPVYGAAADASGDTATDDASTNFLGSDNAPVISGASMTTVVTPTTADYFTNGEKTYQLKVGSDTGDFVLSVNLPDVDDPVLIKYSVATGVAAGVTNAEVLAAIVKLIASINKQIKALQKSLKR